MWSRSEAATITSTEWTGTRPRRSEPGPGSTLLAATDEIDESEIRAIVPEGTEPPADVPDDIFQAALATFLEGERLDMQTLATQVGISRSTLYRRVDDRDALLGEVLWFLTRLAVVRALAAGQEHRGADRVVAVIEAFMLDVSTHEPFRRFLDQESEAALRILTGRGGPVQRRLIALTARLMVHEVDAGELTPFIDVDTLAYIIVRIGESFLYADVIAAAQEPDLELHRRVVEQLLADPG